MSPDSWKGVLHQSTNSLKNWLYAVYGSEGDLGALRHVKTVYLEAGSYGVGLWAPVANFPRESLYWKNVVGYEFVHLVHRTPMALNPFLLPSAWSVGEGLQPSLKVVLLSRRLRKDITSFR